VRAHHAKVHAVTDDPHQLAVLYERLVHNRALLIGTHVILASIVAAVYLNQLNLWQHSYWFKVGLSIVATLVPPLFPYLISAFHSCSLVTPDRLRLAVFIAFLIVSTAFITSLLLGRFGSINWDMLLVVFIAQTIAYVWGANVLFGVCDAL
jgi:hypothetical protein